MKTATTGFTLDLQRENKEQVKEAQDINQDLLSPKRELPEINEEEETAVVKFDPINTLTARALDMLLIGYTSDQCADVAQMDEEKFLHLVESKVGVEYLNHSMEVLNSQLPVERKKLIMELYSRLHKARDRDAVAIIQQISKMLEYENQDTNVAIQINFAQDDWAVKKD
jgi:hypothetical protein